MHRGLHGGPPPGPGRSARSAWARPRGRTAPRSRPRTSAGRRGGSTSCPGRPGRPAGCWSRRSRSRRRPAAWAAPAPRRSGRPRGGRRSRPPGRRTTRSRTSGSGTGCSAKITWYQRCAPLAVARSIVRTVCRVIWRSASTSTVMCSVMSCRSSPASASPSSRRASCTGTSAGAAAPSRDLGQRRTGAPGRPDAAAQGARVEAEQLLDLRHRVEGGRLLGVPLPRSPVAQRADADPVAPVREPALQADQRAPPGLEGPTEHGREAVLVRRSGRTSMWRHAVEGELVRTGSQPERENPGVHRSRSRYVKGARLRCQRTGASGGVPVDPVSGLLASATL